MSDEEFKIDKGVEIPDHGKCKKSKYPFGKLEVGDSFLVGKDDVNSASSCAYNYAAKSKKGVKITRRKVAGGTRFWRTK